MTNNTALSPSQQKKNRLLLLLILASFVLPFVAGDLAYKFGWYQGGKTNHGQLIDPPVAFSGFAARHLTGEMVTPAFVRPHWWLLYVVPADCEQSCRNRLFQMRQVRKALGRESDRVRPLLVTTTELSVEVRQLLNQEFADFDRLQADAGRINAAMAAVMPEAASNGNLFIMDPMGWIMLTYAPEPDEKSSVIKAEDILNDMKKLLKASRIG
jgi:cytochrome oxidase Cu insertion factor (SCO1/SenC/PrrC family)